MPHSHGDDQRRLGDRRALRGALALVAVFAVVEVVAGYAAGSLALLADAGHMLGDAGSLGLALFAAWLGSRPASPDRSFGYRRAEILAALANGVALVRGSSWTLLRESVAILLEGTPRELDAEEIGRAMIGVPGVREVHDLHVWTITSGFPSLSAHVLVAQGSDCHGKRRELEYMLAERFGLSHTTLQVDHADAGSARVELGTAEARRTPL